MARVCEPFVYDDDTANEKRMVDDAVRTRCMPFEF